MLRLNRGLSLALAIATGIAVFAVPKVAWAPPICRGVAYHVGTYEPAERPAECDSTAIKPIDPTRATDQLEVSDDLKTVTETYTRDGKVFKVVYDVTGTQKF